MMHEHFPTVASQPESLEPQVLETTPVDMQNTVSYDVLGGLEGVDLDCLPEFNSPSGVVEWFMGGYDPEDVAQQQSMRELVTELYLGAEPGGYSRNDPVRVAATNIANAKLHHLATVKSTNMQPRPEQAGDLTDDLTAEVASFARSTAQQSVLELALLVRGRLEMLEREKAYADLLGKDRLTGLLNEVGLDKFVNELLVHYSRRAQDTETDREGAGITVVAMDLAKFKWVNDLFNHEVGNASIQIATRWLESLLRDSDQSVIVRPHGDELQLIIVGEMQEDELAGFLGRLDKAQQDKLWRYDESGQIQPVYADRLQTAINTMSTLNAVSMREFGERVSLSVGLRTNDDGEHEECVFADGKFVIRLDDLVILGFSAKTGRIRNLNDFKSLCQWFVLALGETPQSSI